MKLSRLRGRKTSEFLLRKGRVWKGRCMVIRWLPGHPKVGRERAERAVYVGTFASGKVSASSVERNRMRRRCREALRLGIGARPALPAVQLLLCPRSSSLEASFADIQADVERFLRLLPSA